MAVAAPALPDARSVAESIKTWAANEPRLVSLLAASKVVFTSKNSSCDTLQLTLDGKSVFCGTSAGSADSKSSAYDPKIFEYTVATGKSRLVYRRAGVYRQPLPYVPGSEGAGTVVAVGEGVTDVAVGDRVAWHDAAGSYAETG